LPWAFHPHFGWVWVPKSYAPYPQYYVWEYGVYAYYPPAFALIPPELQLLLIDIGKGILIIVSAKLLWILGKILKRNLKERFSNLPAYYCMYCGSRLAYAPEYGRWYCPREGLWY